MRRWVLHLDMDAFFASVEQLTRPTLRGRPVLVGGAGPRGVVAAASYEARPSGAHSAMAMGEARRLCPNAVVLPPRFAVYRAVSEQVMSIIKDTCPVIEQVALDEAFFEPAFLSGAAASEVATTCEQLRLDVRRSIGLSASIGAASGKQMAKVASETAKPDGYRVLDIVQEHEQLRALPVRGLWGVGPVAETRLLAAGVRTAGELAARPVAEIESLIGKAVGSTVHRLARGEDDRPVLERAAPKQVSAETTLEADVRPGPALREVLDEMAALAVRRLGPGRAARTVTVKLKMDDYSQLTRSETLPKPTRQAAELMTVAAKLLSVARAPAPVRLVGVALSNLDAMHGPPGVLDRGAQASLFDPPGDPSGAEPAREPCDQGRAEPAARTPEHWHAGMDLHHDELGHGWAQGCGFGRVTVRFETRSTHPGRAVTFELDDPMLAPADPLASLD
ncbi:MAG: DNA polymerase IV [Acidimicrobiales bacterium]